MRLLLLALVVLAGCGRVRIDQPLDQLPSSLSWCGPAPRAVSSESESAAVSSLFPEDFFERCHAVLGDESWGVKRPWRWRAEFGLSTNEDGRVTSVCVWGANFGNPTRSLACVAETLKDGAVPLPANLDKESHFFVFVYD